MSQSLITIMKWMHLGCGPGQYYTGSTCQACPTGTSEAATGESLTFFVV